MLAYGVKPKAVKPTNYYKQVYRLFLAHRMNQKAV